MFNTVQTAGKQWGLTTWHVHTAGNAEGKAESPDGDERGVSKGRNSAFPPPLETHYSLLGRTNERSFHFPSVQIQLHKEKRFQRNFRLKAQTHLKTPLKQSSLQVIRNQKSSIGVLQGLWMLVIQDNRICLRGSLSVNSDELFSKKEVIYESHRYHFSLHFPHGRDFLSHSFLILSLTVSQNLNIPFPKQCTFSRAKVAADHTHQTT